ncbi:hypothetical protein [Mangrovimonas cancribranchiae]|uniref:Lipoprotein n=1 Tax=Mangrovimonas cancribranchiae TaxID=3080055 RepID=A0AAU6P2W9_9FLAO
MIVVKKLFLALGVTLVSCNFGNLKFMGDIENNLKEVSAVETITQSDLYWVIEDSGNDNVLYGLDDTGNLISEVRILNSKNKDWEDLTSDNLGNIYIGDFGNNSKKRKKFQIYKVTNPQDKTETTAEVIEFKLPKKMKSEDFEGFFLYQNYFYIFSKEKKSAIMIKVKNEIGEQKAKFVTKFKLKGKKTKITSADISSDGKTVILLNHDKLWKLSNYSSDNFFNGDIEKVPFKHNSQKEGLCFKNDTIIITDERNGSEGGNMYQLK